MSEELLIEYKNVNIDRKDLNVLQNVDFELRKGEFVYFIGKVGSGKSSLLKTFYADVPIEEGNAKVFDYDMTSIRKRDIPQLRRKIGIVFQDFQLLTDRSVQSNLEFVLKATGWKDKEEIASRVEAVLTMVGMQNKNYKMPHELSGGEQQRVVIARAMLNSPEIILADEPTGNLDPETGNLITQLLHDICTNGTAVIMTTHNLNLLKTFPGKVIEFSNKHISEINTENKNEII
jgi:cell division transport system ATP-binding protein